MLGIFKTEYMVEVYGKLPFYKDYINTIASPSGSLWQEWMLKVFGQKNTLIPEGIWHFLFFPAKDAPLITGIIMQSSDGLRNFPFSLFVPLGKSGIKNELKWAQLFAVRDGLLQIYKALYTVSDIDDFYQTLSGQKLETSKKEIKSGYLSLVDVPDLKPFTRALDNEFPIFTIISTDRITGLSKANFSGSEIIDEWERTLAGPDMRISNSSVSLHEHIKL